MRPRRFEDLSTHITISSRKTSCIACSAADIDIMQIFANVGSAVTQSVEILQLSDLAKLIYVRGSCKQTDITYGLL